MSIQIFPYFPWSSQGLNFSSPHSSASQKMSKLQAYSTSANIWKNYILPTSFNVRQSSLEESLHHLWLYFSNLFNKHYLGKLLQVFVSKVVRQRITSRQNMLLFSYLKYTKFFASKRLFEASCKLFISLFPTVVNGC